MDSGRNSNSVFDTIIIGSGFGGAMVGYAAVRAGQKVLMLERGPWVTRGMLNWAPEASGYLTPYYSKETPYNAIAGGNFRVMGQYNCVGGPSVFYGCISLRLRESDFHPRPEIVDDSGAEWPINYRELEPYYSRAEQILNVAGEMGTDPTEPFRSLAYPQALPTLSSTSQRIANAAVELGLKPFRLPLAINFSNGQPQAMCEKCITCNTFACAIGAKNDLATTVFPKLQCLGLELRANTVATRIVSKGERIMAVECYDKSTNSCLLFTGRTLVLSAGALASPHLILASGLEKMNPSGHLVGRFLMRHCNSIVFGVYPTKPNKSGGFYRELGFHDFYYGDESIRFPQGNLGAIQQHETPPAGLVRAFLPQPIYRLLSPLLEYMTGLMAIAEDQPQYQNRIFIDKTRNNRFGLPIANIVYRSNERDKAANRALVRRCKQILRKSGALFSYVHKIRTFSHAVGTLRFGKDPVTSVLDKYCRFRGIQNLYVVDGSFMPTSGVVNPSLTIAANALRVGDYITQQDNK